MAVITKAMAADRTQLLAAQLIPELVMKAIGQDELADRLAAATSLSRRAATATDPVLRRSFKLRAQAILNAQPRAVTEAEHKSLIAKAAGVRDTMQAAALRGQAADLLEEHPPAPRTTAATAVAKASADRAVRRAAVAKPNSKPGKPVRVFDSRMRPLGVVGRHSIKKAASGDKTPMQAVFDQDGNLIGVVDPAQIQPVAGSGSAARPSSRGQSAPAGQPAPTGQAAPAQSAAVAKARAASRVPQLVPASDRAAAVFLHGWREAAARTRQNARRTGRR